MKPYLWMTDYTPQEEWIDHQGLLLWLAFFLTEIGAGLYLISLFFGLWGGCLVGWLISAILGGGLHMLYLGKPERAWRALLRPAKSELSRGMILMILFLGVGAFHIAPSLGFLGFLPWESSSLFFKIVLTILCFFVITHGFMTMNVMAAIPFWNSSILPVLSLSSGIWLGTQMAMVGSMGSIGRESLIAMELLARWSLFSYSFLVIFYFWNAHHASLAVKESLKVVLKGHLSLLFYLGLVLVGLVIPILITLNLWAKDMSTGLGWVYLRIICAFIGDLSLRYLISKSGRYSPLIYTNIVRE